MCFFSTKTTDSSLWERLKDFSVGESKMMESLSLSARLMVPFNWVLFAARVFLDLIMLNVPRLQEARNVYIYDKAKDKASKRFFERTQFFVYQH